MPLVGVWPRVVTQFLGTRPFFAAVLFRGAECQGIISLSTAESEYVAATCTAKEALLHCTQLFSLELDSTTFFSANHSHPSLLHKTISHAHTKHLDIRFHFIY
jgi:hypothetical protein